MNRRDWLKSAAHASAGLAFISCCSPGATGAVTQTSPQARRQVSIGGRRIRTIDFHSHCAVPGIMEMMGQTTPLNGVNGELILGTDRLRQMDAQGIDIEVLSINPFWYPVERELAAAMIRTQNEKLSEFCATHSDRFVGLASVALQHPDMAAQQFEDGVKRLGLRGCAIGGSVNGEELASPRFDPFWAKAQELGSPVFIHPQPVPEFRSRLQGSGVLTNVIGNPLETTIALSHLIFEGTLDRYPNLKICAAHGGGYLPSYADRSDLGCITLSQQCKPLRKKPTEYLRELFVDSMVFSSEGLRHLAAVCGTSQIVMGTDYPYPWTKTAVDHILNTPDFNDSERAAILGENAERLLGLRS
jgi:aminocarboxymuconate-semialdehyde decarboxylase